MPDDVIAIAGLLAELGFVALASQRRARKHLEAAALTNPSKKNIQRSKRDAVEEVVRTRIARSCGSPACERVLASSGREVIEVDAPFCEVCRGSEGERALLEMADALVAAGRPPARRRPTANRSLEPGAIDGGGQPSAGTASSRSIR